MKIHIKDIRPEGLELDATLEPQATGLTEKDSLYFVAPLNITAKAQRFEDTVIVETHLEGKISSICSRCLCDVEKDWIKDFTLDFPIARNAEYIDMDEDLRQEIILNLPMRVLCGGQCKGICSKCGINLNEKKCKCNLKLLSKKQEVEKQEAEK